MFNSKLLGMSVISVLAVNMNAEAKLYKWVDDKGTTHYGEIIPPEYANKDRDTLRKSGLLEKRPEKIDPAVVRAKEEEEEKRNIAKQKEIEEQRRNSTLLNTYSNENEIEMARDRSLVLINARIDSNKLLMKSTQSSLDDLNKESESRKKAGKKIPQSLINDIAQTEARAARYSEELSKSAEELDIVKKRFEQDKILYRKLKGETGKK